MVRIREINGLPVAETQDLKNNVHKIHGMPDSLLNKKAGERIKVYPLHFTACVYLDGKFWMPCLNTILYVQDKSVERWRGSV